MNCFLTVISFIIFSSSVSAGVCNEKLVQKVKDSWNSGKIVMIIAWSENESCGDENEACGDWADRLNLFKEKQGDSIEIFKISPSSWKRVVKMKPTKIQAQSHLFLKKEKESFFNSGPIFDYDIYSAVLRYWDSKSISKPVVNLPKKVDVSFCR